MRAVADMNLAHLLWLEQPLDRLDWDGTRHLCGRTALPIVLDECIYDEGDIRRAAAVGACGIKLKLMKNFGLKETVRLAGFARAMGLLVVFGNGVATDIGNLAEFLVLGSAHDLFSAPSESSGFGKMQHMILPSLELADGYIRCRMSADTIEQGFRRTASNMASFEAVRVRGE